MNETGERKLLELLIFELGDQRYGLPVSDVREIVRAVPPVPLPGAPGIIEGVINLRGRVVPVLDIRRRFQLPARPLEHTDHLVIVQLACHLAALRVDRATDLAVLAAADVDDLRDSGSGGQNVDRIARFPDGLVLILDLQTLLSGDEAAVLEGALVASLAPAGRGGQP